MAYKFNPFTGQLDDAITLTGSGSVAAAQDGTAALPGISFANDLNTGIYRPGADQVAIATNGTGRLFVDASGDIGFGIASPSSLGTNITTVEIQGKTTTRSGGLRLSTSDSSQKAAFYIYDGGCILGTETAHPLGFYINNTERMRLDSSGRLGLGTSSPLKELQINATTPTIRLEENSGGSKRLELSVNSSAEASVFATQSASQLLFGTDGTERMRIDSSGRVGVGTTSPGQALSVNGNILSSSAGTNYVASSSAGNTTTYLITDSSGGNVQVDGAWPIRFTTNSAERARIDNSGRLLVGTSSARANFYNSPVDSRILLESNSISSGERILANVHTSASANGPIFLLAKSRSASIGGNTLVVGGDAIGTIDFQGNDGSEFVGGARIQAEVDGTPGANDMPGRLVFSTTADGGASPTERMRIDSSGSVLIGVNTKAIAQTTNPYLFFQAQATSTASGLAIESYGNNTATRYHFGFTNPNGVVGSISTNGSATAYNTSSDYRLKENIVAVTDGITRLQQLKPSRFNFIADPAKTVDGFLAHEVQTVVPEAITGEKDAVDDEGNPQYQGIDQSKLVPLLTAALQEAIGEIESLKARVAALETP